MVDLIAKAYGVNRERIVGGPSWMDTQKFDIIAAVPAGVAANAVRPMLRALLADRFKLTIHDSRKMLPVYALTVGRKFKLKGTPGDLAGRCYGPTPGPKGTDRFICSEAPMKTFVAEMNDSGFFFFDRWVIDQTGLADRYDFELQWSTGTVPGAAIPATPREAIEKQLGLNVEAQSAELPVLVVDNVNRTPTPNAPGVTTAVRANTPKEFDAAEVRAHAPGAPGSFATYNDRAEIYGLTFRNLISVAYDIKDKSLTGEPGWADTERFDVIAKSSRRVPWENMQIMLQNLIVERFHFTYHTAEQPIPVYALVVAKQPVKLGGADPANRSDCRQNSAAGITTLTCKNTTMAQLIEKLRNSGEAAGYLDRPAVDLSGLAGGFDFSLTWSSFSRMNSGTAAPRPADPAGTVEASTPTGDETLFEAFERQLGLRFDKREHPMPVMVVDHVERPSGN